MQINFGPVDIDRPVNTGDLRDVFRYTIHR